jgi:hypothetical protein
MLRLNAEQYATIQNRIHASKPKPLAKRNKYGAEPCEIDGRRFDSKAEGRRYQVLNELERRGEIIGLECQVPFELIPAQIIAGKKERSVRYLCDFRYVRDGEVIVEDVKSRPTRTREYILKRKLMFLVYRIVVTEVME